MIGFADQKAYTDRDPKRLKIRLPHRVVFFDGENQVISLKKDFINFGNESISELETIKMINWIRLLQFWEIKVYPFFTGQHTNDMATINEYFS